MCFEIVQGDEQLSSHLGLALAGAILDRASIQKQLNAVVLPEQPFPRISYGEVATAMVGLIYLGKPDFDTIESFRDNPFFTQCLGLGSVLSSPTLRQRLDSTKGDFNGIILEDSAEDDVLHDTALWVLDSDYQWMFNMPVKDGEVVDQRVNASAYHGLRR